MLRHLWGSPVFRLLLSVGRGLLWIAAGCLLLSGLLLLTAVPDWLLRTAADVLWGIGAFRAGLVYGFHARRHGIASGLLCGLLLCAILLAGCVCMGGALHFRRCGWILLLAVCGGICGVNRKIVKPPD